MRSSTSRCTRIETYSPAPIENAPASRPEMPASTITARGWSAPANPMISAAFDTRPSFTPKIAAELDTINRLLLEEGRPYLLLGFGRWGSSDPWLGIPVEWGQIAGARVMVESTLPGMDVEPSQGAHFFHNIISFEVFYLCVRHEEHVPGARCGINWDWLNRQSAVAETDLVRHIRLDKPLRIKVDGRSGHGAVWHP